MIVKIGPKQKHLKVPNGFFVVQNGFCLKDDMFAYVGNPNSPFWHTVEKDDIGMPYDSFDCLIRKIT